MLTRYVISDYRIGPIEVVTREESARALIKNGHDNPRVMKDCGYVYCVDENGKYLGRDYRKVSLPEAREARNFIDLRDLKNTFYSRLIGLIDYELRRRGER